MIVGFLILSLLCGLLGIWVGLFMLIWLILVVVFRLCFWFFVVLCFKAARFVDTLVWIAL